MLTPASSSPVRGAPANIPPPDPAFDIAMERLGPFERKPRIVAGVSGGRDSMALALMAKAWTDARGGDLLAVTVDHRLRPGSADEAAEAGIRLSRFGIPHRIVVRTGPLATGNGQAAARDARYRLLTGACRDAGALHLLVGHHLEDQGETAAMRAERGSGEHGLAAMAPLSELPEARLLRPLLARPRSDLEAYLVRLGVAWADDPTNLEPSSARGRLRSALTAAQLGNMGREAAGRASARRLREDEVADLLVRTVELHESGIARIDIARMLASPPGEAALGRLIATVGGRVHPPRSARLAGLAARLAKTKSAATLGGCALIPARSGWWCGREAGRVREALKLGPGGQGLWDGRFHVVNPGPSPVAVGRRPRPAPADARPWPAALDRALPAFFSEDGRLLESDKSACGLDYTACPYATFRPRSALAGSGFALVSSGARLN